MTPAQSLPQKRVGTITDLIGEYINRAPGPLTANRIARMLDINENTVRGALGRLKTRGRIQRIAGGLYGRAP